MDGDSAGEAGLAAIAVWPVAVAAAATKTVLDQLVIYRHIEPQFRVGYQVAAHTVIEIAAGRFGGDVEL